MNMNPIYPLISKIELHELADSLILQEKLGIDRCVEFVLTESRGLWHGRARAMMCRRLKHCELSQKQQIQLVNCILTRLSKGNFSEQFKDQIRLALHLDPKSTMDAATKLTSSQKGYVAKYARWILSNGEQFSVVDR